MMGCLSLQLVCQQQIRQVETKLKISILPKGPLARDWYQQINDLEGVSVL